MSSTDSDTIVDRVERVKHSLGATTGDPSTVQAAVDGPCPAEGCDGRVVAVVHADSSVVHCDTCGGDFRV
ncbi:hypothetical protein [Amnibacterium endophyticum]|uniref:Uncharacterized protein n=1 Tax=Amnibacterium endophyticum TaxID=2109337 RepID=A0ABW4LI89_9MICO